MNEELQVKERFIGFIKTASTTGEALEQIIYQALLELGLSAPTYLVAQGYDGGANMSGQVKGVAGRIRSKIL